MKGYIVKKNLITVTDMTDFDIKKICECGQLFRFTDINGKTRIISGEHRAFLWQENGVVFIECDDEKYFEKYFDLQRNYDIIRLKLKDKSLFEAAVDFGQGIRILNQQPFETLISFIISANNNITRIKGIIERLSASLGDDMGGYFSFPSPQKIAAADFETINGLGAGYRARYIHETARAVAEGRFDLDAPFSAKTDCAKRGLLQLLGVGDKVADCILLFAYHKADVFPVDTWIKKVYNCYYGREQSRAVIRRSLLARFGDLSGYAQQYLFYYKRELDNHRIDGCNL